MRFVQFADESGPEWGVRTETSLYRLSAFAEGEPTLRDVSDPGYRRAVARAISTGVLPTVEDARPLAPVRVPGKIVCVGLNYHDHAAEQDEDVPEKPLLFAKSPTAVTDPNDPIVIPAAVEQVDYEVELAVVIGRTATDVAIEEAREYVAGYTILNDVSARDAQFDDGQFFRGKSYDTFAPMGPTLVTDDEIDPNALAVSLSVNGEEKQRSTTSEFIFDVDEVIAYVSEITTLRPGDVISTGTPGGVGIFRDPPDLLSPGDTVTATIEGIGELSNPVVELS